MLENLRNNECFEFTSKKGGYCISKLRDETIEIYLSITQFARSRPLSDSLKQDHRISKYYYL